MDRSIPVATILCRTTGERLEGLPSPVGFGKLEHRTVQASCDLDLYPGDVVNVGRSHKANTISIDSTCVSYKHFVIYSVVDDEVHFGHQPPLVYVRDRQSTNGTRVNGDLIGSRRQGKPRGFLLNHGDIISISPNWSFHIELENYAGANRSLTTIQKEEAKAFSDRYVITDRTLGFGAYGSIYLALEKATSRQLVCKVHNLDAKAPGDLRRILHETDLLGKLGHPNLLDFEYAYRSPHTLFTFTELATRGDLFSMVCFYEKKLPLRDTKFIVQQVVKAVRYLHKNKIGHRDVKPENIFFEIGPYAQGRVILGDLGFAKGVTWGRMASKVGTRGYVAPEVYRGGSPYGLAMDMWSIGVLTLGLLMPVCVSALSDSADQESLDYSLDQIFSQIRSARGSLSELLQDFISRCLTTDPDQRLTAQQAKSHSWFHEQPDRDIIKKRLKEIEKAWRPTHLIAPPVEELPERGLAATTPSSNARNDQIAEPGEEVVRVLKRKHDEVIPISPGVQESWYFKKSSTAAATATSKKAKKTRHPLKHHRTGPPIQIAPTRTSSTGSLSWKSQ